MSIIIKTKEEIEILREGGKRLATVLYKIKEIENIILITKIDKRPRFYDNI